MEGYQDQRLWALEGLAREYRRKPSIGGLLKISRAYRPFLDEEVANFQSGGAPKHLLLSSGRRAVLEAAREYNPAIGSFERFAFPLARLAMDDVNEHYLKTQGKHKEIMDDATLADLDSILADDGLNREKIKQGILKLSRAERLIIILYYYEEMTHKEIGVTFDLTEHQIRKMHVSALINARNHALGKK